MDLILDSITMATLGESGGGVKLGKSGGWGV